MHGYTKQAISLIGVCLPIGTVLDDKNTYGNVFATIPFHSAVVLQYNVGRSNHLIRAQELFVLK